MNKIILGFVGDLAAGKGTVAKYLTKKYHINAYRFSTIIRDVLDRLYISQSRENMQLLSRVLRENFNQDVLSRVIARDVQNDPHELVVVDGIRRPTDITYLKEIPGFHLIYLTADAQVRWQRLVQRRENPGDEIKTFEEFTHDERAEAECLIKELGRQAEDTIMNNETTEELYANVEKLITKYKSQSV